MRVVFSLVVLVVLVSTTAHAEPPTPVGLPDLTRRDELVATTTVAGGNSELDALAIDAGGRLQLGVVELFGSVPAVVYRNHSGDVEVGLGNVRAGARAQLSSPLVPGLTAALATWVWLPSSLLEREPDSPSPESLDALLGIRDPYAWSEGFALGVAADVRWGGSRAFVQAQLGFAAVIVRGLERSRLELDDVFAALGAGARLGHGREVAVEYRMVIEPALVETQPEHHHAVAVALSQRHGSSLWRVRAGLAKVDLRFLPEHFEGGGGYETTGAYLGFDLVKRL